MKPKPWDANRWPTPQEWLDWFLTLDYSDQSTVANRVVDAHQAAHTCLVANHDGLVQRVYELEQQVSDERMRKP